MFKTFIEAKEYIESQKRNEKKVNLDYMYKLCAVFNNPQNDIKFIHIGGTNGKGSTVSYLKQILLEAGKNVGTYTSPYVVCFNERITYNDKYISDEDIVKYANIITAKDEELKTLGLRKPSFFEMMTLLAFLYFHDQKDLDIVVMEVGIGGLLDATNVIMPLVSAVASVSYDHMDILGNTLKEIWNNKLGIVKEGIPFVTHQNQEFYEDIYDACKKKNAPLFLTDKDKLANVVTSFTESHFDYDSLKNCVLNLPGKHQIENAMLAIEIIKHLPEYSISDEIIKKGLAKTFWPGRLEIISNNPIIFIDGAHNPDGIMRLTEFIKTVKENHHVRLIFAVSSNKDKGEMLKIIEPVVDEIIFTHFGYKRSENEENLILFSNHPHRKIVHNLEEIILEVKNDQNSINFFCGSLFFISEVRKYFMEK